MSQEVLIAVVAAGVLVALVLVTLVTARSSRGHRRDLRERFGPEYDRALEEYGTPSRAEQALAERARRVERFRIHDLEAADRAHFAASWRLVQARFVDDPQGAVHEANTLIKRVMLARGYPMEAFEQRVADLSVDHANVVQHYRAARALFDANRNGQANTEELRQAFVHYRALFADLLAVEHHPSRSLQEVRV